MRALKFFSFHAIIMSAESTALRRIPIFSTHDDSTQYKAMLLPGEVEDLSRAVEKLCGYRANTIEEIKNA